ncbi:MAG TPA: hypothetical protein VJW51_14390 [Candidatus Acidoferrales bacterium]|nr:hypothetical protein [Candidatus Acidoferrales bacterium]
MKIEAAARWGGCGRVLRVLVAAAALACGCLPAAAQSDDPLTPAPPHAVRKIPREGRVETAPIPVEKIIQSLVAREDEYLRAHMMYGFKRIVRVQEITPGGEKGSEAHLESEVFLADNGKRYERKTQKDEQRFLDLKSGTVDAQAAAQVPLFPLASDQMKYYDLIYKGSQPLDELNTYIFEVKPKSLLPNRRLFSGLIYVDDQDLAIVKVYGKWIALEEDDAANSPARPSPFSMYEIYYENVDAKYWFPTYFRSDAYVHTKAGDVQLRLIVRMTGFKVAAPVPIPAGGASTPGPASPSPAPPAEPSKPAAERPAKP